MERVMTSMGLADSGSASTSVKLPIVFRSLLVYKDPKIASDWIYDLPRMSSPGFTANLVSLSGIPSTICKALGLSDGSMFRLIVTNQVIPNSIKIVSHPRDAGIFSLTGTSFNVILPHSLNVSPSIIRQIGGELYITGSKN